MAHQARLERRGLACVVLAAGGSTRLGRAKQLVQRRMRPLLLETCRTAMSIRPITTVIVLGADALRLRRLLRARCKALHFVKNGAWQDGMAGSLRLGLKHLPPRCRAALVLLCDQPDVGPVAVRRLCAAWQRRPRLPAAACYASKVGAPAILPRRLWSKLDALTGDQGARSILRGMPAITLVDMPEAELDLDTPADLARFERGFSAR